MEIAEIIVAIVVAIFASTGFWTFAQTVYQAKSKKITAERILLTGLARSEIIRQANEYIEKGTISSAEYREFCMFCEAYKKLPGGNGGGSHAYDMFLQKVSVSE